MSDAMARHTNPRFPPISRAEAVGLLGILEKYVPLAYTMLGINRPIAASDGSKATGT